MWMAPLLLLRLLALVGPLRAQDDAPVTVPQDCSLGCIQQGGPGCEYCRITRADIKEALGFNSIAPFGSCIPWPCFDLLGTEDPKICQHYVHSPTDVKVEFVHEPNPEFDTIVVSWRPSYYGIAFLRGFQVSLQALGGSSIACQLFLFHRNLSLPVSHTQMVYKSDPFPGLSLGAQYAITVMALPVPEEWERFYRSEIFSTRSCAEKNGLDKCKKDWHPRHVEVQQEGTAVTVTFDLAPPSLGIRGYFSLCYANGMKKYIDITPNSSDNKTRHSYQLDDLQEGTNYTCAIAANEMDAVRKTFNIQVTRVHREGASPPSVTPSLALMLPLCLAVVAIVAVLLAALTRRKPRQHIRKLFMKPGLPSPSPAACGTQHPHEGSAQGEAVSLPRGKLTPPRLLICYSGRDGPAHIKAVMQLGAFIQQHMATQVCLDLWDSLSVAREGSMAWYCRQIRECDFILVVCSRGLNCEPVPADQEDDAEEEDLPSGAFSPDAAVQLIGEEVGRAKSRGRDMSKYMAAIFEYSEETDIPTELRLASHYVLMCDLALLFSHLHGVALHRPGGYLKINHISEEGFTQLPAGAALQLAVYEARMELRAKSYSLGQGGD